MALLIDMELKRCESIECWTHVVIFNVPLFYDLDLVFSRSNFEKKSFLMNGMAGWHETKGGESSEWPMLWLSMFTSSMTLTLGFQGRILRKLYLRNGMADWHGKKGMWVDRMLHPLCDFQFLPEPWPWPLIFKVKFWKKRIRTWN